MSGVPQGLLWTPGNGFTTQRERQVAKAVQEYESDLILGQRKDTGEWVVYLSNGPLSNGEPFPIFSFGNELPHPDDAKKKLWKADIRRHGKKIVSQIMAKNAQAEAELKRKSEEADDMLAEAMIEGFRNQGFDPFHRSLPNKHPKNRGHNG